MEVVLGATCLRPDGAGTTTYVNGLLGALPAAQRPHTTVIVQRDAAGSVPAGFAIKPVPVVSGVRRAIVNKTARSPGDVFHGLDVDLPIGWRGPSVATIHDLAVFDVPWACSRFRAAGERRLLRHTARVADVLVAVSEFTADRIRVRLGRDAEVIAIAPATDMVPPTPACVEDVRQRHKLPDRFVLHVGTVEPRKNLGRLASACQAAGLPLLLAGAMWDTTPLPGDVRRLGFVDREDLPALYAAATVSAYVSVYEGFGLPPVEAMACGATVLCSTVASLRPLLGEDSAEWVNPHDIEAITQGMLRLSADADLRAERSRHGRAAAATLRFESTAQASLEVWRRLT